MYLRRSSLEQQIKLVLMIDVHCFLQLIPPRGCAFIAMKDRGGAASVMRHLKNRRFQGTTVKVGSLKLLNDL